MYVGQLVDALREIYNDYKHDVIKVTIKHDPHVKCQHEKLTFIKSECEPFDMAPLKTAMVRLLEYNIDGKKILTGQCPQCGKIYWSFKR